MLTWELKDKPRITINNEYDAPAATLVYVQYIEIKKRSNKILLVINSSYGFAAIDLRDVNAIEIDEMKFRWPAKTRVKTKIKELKEFLER